MADKSLESLHEKLDQLLDLFEKAVERFDKALEKSESSELSKKMDEVLEQNSQIADGIVELSEMIKDLQGTPTPKKELHGEMFSDLEGPKLPPLSPQPKRKLFRKE